MLTLTLVCVCKKRFRFNENSISARTVQPVHNLSLTDFELCALRSIQFQLMDNILNLRLGIYTCLTLVEDLSASTNVCASMVFICVHCVEMKKLHEVHSTNHYAR